MNLGKIEVCKTVATLVSLCAFELAGPGKDWSIHNSNFPRHSGGIMRIMKREGTDEKISNIDLDY